MLSAAIRSMLSDNRDEYLRIKTRGVPRVGVPRDGKLLLHGIARVARGAVTRCMYGNAILLLDDGESFVQITKFLYLDDDTIRGWYKSYRESGWESLALFLRA